MTTTVPDTENHPVWAVYDELRTARLNIKYLQAQIRCLSRWNFAHEILIAISTSSAVAGFSFWDTFAGGYTWKTIGAFATILSITKPILKLADKIKQKQELLSSYQILDYDLNRISLEIRTRQKYDQSLQDQFFKALERKADLVKQDADSVNEKLRVKCRKSVESELPTSSFYIPTQ